MKIILINNNRLIVPTKKQFQLWINTIVHIIPNKIPTAAQEITINIVDKTTSHALNKTYRNKDYPTNVLSFHYDAMPGIESQSLGDLAICAEIVETEARDQQKSSESHWAHLTIHGMLHLLGYDHVIETDATIMESLEIRMLQSLGFRDPYS